MLWSDVSLNRFEQLLQLKSFEFSHFSIYSLHKTHPHPTLEPYEESHMKHRKLLVLLLPALVLSTGLVQSTRPSLGTEKPPELMLVLVSHNKAPAVGVPIVLIDNSVETVYKSAGARGLTRKPGDIVAKGRTNEKGELAVAKIKAGTYAYEAGDPEKWGYANGQIEIKDAEKPKRIEVVLSQPMR